MTWRLDEDDYEEIASTFADLGGFGGVCFERQCEGVASWEDRSAYMREARAQGLPEAQRWRENEKRARDADPERKIKQNVTKARKRRPAAREKAWPVMEIVTTKRGQLAVEFRRAG